MSSAINVSHPSGAVPVWVPDLSHPKGPGVACCRSVKGGSLVNVDLCADGFTDRFRITGYVDGATIQPCVDCGVPVNGDPWDGTLPDRDTDIFSDGAFFDASCRFNGHPSSYQIIAGKLAFATLGFFPGTQSQATNYGAWWLTIYCFDGVIDGEVFWQGFLPGSRHTGTLNTTPAGVYTRFAGCDTSPTIEIEQYTP